MELDPAMTTMVMLGQQPSWLTLQAVLSSPQARFRGISPFCVNPPLLTSFPRRVVASATSTPIDRRAVFNHR